MKTSSITVCFILAMPCLANAGVFPVSSSSFDSGAEGWSTVGMTITTGYQAAGGNTGGYFYGRSMGDGPSQFITDPFYFSAPTAILSSASAAYGGFLSYEIKRFVGYENVLLGGPPELIISGGGLRLVFADLNISNNWERHEIPLFESGTNNLHGFVASWFIEGSNVRPTMDQMQSTLSSLDGLYIRGSYSVYGNENIGIDNVTLFAVPEPGTAVLVGLGLVAAIRRRRS